MFQNVISKIVIVLILLIFGFGLGVYYTKPSTIDQSTIDKNYVDSILVKKELHKIDSLQKIVSEYERINSNLRDSIDKISITRTIKVDAVRKLPLDSGVIYLKQKLREFEESN